MTDPNPPGADPPSHTPPALGRDAVRDAVDDYERKFAEGQRPRTDDYLPRVPDRDRFRLLVELVYSELELRVRAGEPARLTEYLDRYPELAGEPAHVENLLLKELDARAEAGERPNRAEYDAAYPRFLPQVAAAFARHAAGQIRLPPELEVYEELGRGGMGVVYKARDLILHRVVAVKVLSRAHLAGEDLKKRFEREARAAALRHPNIVQVYDVGEFDGVPYFTMEYVAGGSLADRVRETLLAPAEAAELAEQIARGAAFAHQNGITHRDLKPGNVVLAPADPDPSGSPPARPVARITDFGLARFADSDDGLRTVTGDLLGTPEYMAPEQARGSRDIGPPADVWAVGVILYRLLTGRLPFKADTREGTILQALQADPVPPRQLLPGIPRDLETIALKCLEKDPARRYPTAAPLAEDLRRLRAGEPISARRPGPAERTARWVRRHPAWATAATAAAGLLVVLAVAYVRQRDANAAIRQQRDDTEKMIEELVKIAGEDDSLKAHDGVTEARGALLTVGINYYRERLARGPFDSRESVNRGRIHLSLGLLHSHLGEWDRAIEEYDAARGLFERALAADPTDRAARDGRATALNRAANDYQHKWLAAKDSAPPADDRESFTRADELYALAAWELEALAAGPDATDDRIELAKTRGNRANLLITADPKSAEARSLFDLALDALAPFAAEAERLAKLPPGERPTFDRRSLAARALRLRSEQLFNLGRALHTPNSSAGEAELLAARRGFETLIEWNGGRAEDDNLVQVLEVLAGWAQQPDPNLDGDPERALTYLGPAIDACREVADRYYGVLGHRRRLAKLFYHRGVVLYRLRKDAAAEKDFRAAREEARRVLLGRWGDAEARAVAGNATYWFARLLACRKDFAAAAAAVDDHLRTCGGEVPAERRLRLAFYRACAGEVEDASKAVKCLLQGRAEWSGAELGLAAVTLYCAAHCTASDPAKELDAEARCQLAARAFELWRGPHPHDRGFRDLLDELTELDLTILQPLLAARTAHP